MFWTLMLWFVWLSLRCPSISFEGKLLAQASSLWQICHQRALTARANTEAPGPLCLVVRRLEPSPLETPSSRDVVHIAIHPSCGEEAFGLEEVEQWSGRSRWWRSERTRGEVVREGCEEPREEAEEDRPAWWTGESNHHTELQHKVCHHPEVNCTSLAYLCWKIVPLESFCVCCVQLRPPSNINPKLFGSLWMPGSLLLVFYILSIHTY